MGREFGQDQWCDDEGGSLRLRQRFQTGQMNVQPVICPSSGSGLNKTGARRDA
jgi:hypothetical protein